MSKSKKILIIVCFILLILVSLKGIFLYWFSPMNKVRVPEFKELTIEHQDAEDYVTWGHFNIRNDFGEYQLVTNNPTPGEQHEVDERANTDSAIYDREDGLAITKANMNGEFDDIYVANIVEYYYLNLYGIHNNYEFFKYIEKNPKVENHFYTPIFTMLKNKYMQEELDKYWKKGSVDTIYFFTGDYDGYYTEINNGQYRIFNIYYKNKIYSMSFNGSKTTREQVFDLISTVIIK